VKWYDNRSVVLASNFVGVGNADEVRRWDKKTKSFVMVKRPEIVKQYNGSMGGVDKLDQLVSLYRTFIKSRKWTLRMVTHAIDLAVVNSWLEYRCTAEQLGLRKKDVLDLLHFRLEVAECLVRKNKPVHLPKKHGRPSCSEPSTPTVEPPTKKCQSERRPPAEVLQDGRDHMPQYDVKKEASRCKRQCCYGKTHIYCDKCQVHYCFVPGRNCFAIAHRDS
jgi:Transposase IS4